MSKKQLKGTVVSNKMQKTVVVMIEMIKQHPKVKKRYKVHKKYKAHDEKETCKIGDKVVIEECRPISKEKRWRVVRPTNNKQQTTNNIKANKQQTTDNKQY